MGIADFEGCDFSPLAFVTIGDDKQVENYRFLVDYPKLSPRNLELVFNLFITLKQYYKRN